MDLYLLIRAMARTVCLSSALWANRSDWRMLLVVCAIAASIFVPIPYPPNPSVWYGVCLVEELLILVVAVALRVPSLNAIGLFCAALCAMHVIGMIIGPMPGLGPYRLIVPILECGELFACAILSAPALNMFVRIANKYRKI
jgi:hypothetical protein